jgi:hypothetical protein
LSNRVVAVLFLSFVLMPVWLADTALREKFARAREFGRALGAIASGRWLPWLLRALRSLGKVRSLPFRQLRSAMLRAFVFLPEVPGILWQAVVNHYRQPSARRMTRPEMLTVRGSAPPW